MPEGDFDWDLLAAEFDELDIEAIEAEEGLSRFNRLADDILEGLPEHTKQAGSYTITGKWKTFNLSGSSVSVGKFQTATDHYYQVHWVTAPNVNDATQQVISYLWGVEDPNSQIVLETTILSEEGNEMPVASDRRELFNARDINRLDKLLGTIKRNKEKLTSGQTKPGADA